MLTDALIIFCCGGTGKRVEIEHCWSPRTPTSNNQLVLDLFHELVGSFRNGHSDHQVWKVLP
jgi:hypothetical protein